MLMTNKLWVVAAGVGCLAGLAACSDGPASTAGIGGFNTGGDLSDGGGSTGAGTGSGGTDNPAAGGSAGVGALPPGAGIGAACEATTDCRVGLACQGMSCAAGHMTAAGSPCVISDECLDGLQCFGRVCITGAPGMAGDACTSDLDCGSGLRCALAGLALTCVKEGTADAGSACVSSTECYTGLGCVGGMCGITPPGAIFGEPWAGVTCAPPEKDIARAYFEVPGAVDAQEGDFFRLPFPNDVRSATGTLDLSGFPTPGAALLGFDPVKLYVDAVSANDTAWGAYPTVTFRFSGPVDGSTLTADNIHLSDITPGSKDFPDDGFWQSTASSGRTNYVCDNWLAMERWHGRPLQPGRTYAFWLSTGIKVAGGGAVQRSENLISLLADTVPTDPKLKAPYVAYKPFRDFIKAGGTRAPQNAALVLNVAVVTVGAIRDPMKALAAAVAAAPAPTTSSWVKCAAGVISPCP